MARNPPPLPTAQTTDKPDMHRNHTLFRRFLFAACLVLMPVSTALASGYRINQKVKHTFHAEEVEATVVEKVFDGKAYRLRIETGRFAGRLVLVNTRVLDRSNPDVANKRQAQGNTTPRSRPGRADPNDAAPQQAPFLASPATADPLQFRPDDHWDLPQPDAQPRRKPASTKPASIILRSKIPYPHGRVELIPAHAGDRVLALASNGPFDDDKSVRLEVLSFARRSSLGATTLDPDTRVLALSPDGSTALVAPHSRAGGLPQTPLTLLDLTRPAAPKTLQRFRVPGLDRASAIQARAWLIDADHLLLYANRQLTAYRTDTLEPIYTTEHFLIYREAPLSPDRNLLLIHRDQTLHLLNARTGEPVGRATLPGINLDTARISPGHRYIASFRAGELTVLNASNAQTLHAIAMPPGPGQVRWIDDRFLTVAGYVFDAERGLPVLRPARSDDPKQPDAQRRPAFGPHTTTARFDHDRHPRDNQRAVVTKTPTSTAPLLRAAQQLDPTAAFAVEPGSAVSLRVDIADATVKQETQQALERAIADAGLVLDANAPTTLNATIRSAQKQQKMERELSGKTFNVQVTESTYTLAIQQAGQTLWQVQTTDSGELRGRFDGRKTNQDMQDLATQRGQTRADFFARRSIPNRVLSPAFLDALPY